MIGAPIGRRHNLVSLQTSGPDLVMSFRIAIIILFVVLTGGRAFAAPCASVKSQPDIWVATEIDLFVTAAHQAYDKDEAGPAYRRVLSEISNTIRRCNLAEDKTFLSRYRVFVEYMEALSIAQRPDHELGFMVPDKQYFEETRQYVQIPAFLLTQNFLKLVTRE